MYKKIACKILVFTMLISMMFCHAAAASETPDINAGSSILVDSRMGQVLYSKQPNKQLHVSTASKIMTALIVIEKTNPDALDSKVTISKESTNTEGFSVNLEVGEKYSIEDLLYSIILGSANDAANALAEHIGGDIPKFVELMNAKAKEINMKDTKFSNPSGLYDESQYTTAYDLSLLVKHAINNATFDRIFSLKAKPWVSKNTTQILINQNKLFWSYDGVDGGKTGYNDKSQQTVITTATRNGFRLISILIDSPEEIVFQESSKLLDYGFDNFKSGTLVYKGQILKTINIDNQQINLTSGEDIYYTFPLGENYIYNIEFDLPQDLKLPVSKQRMLGTARYTLKDNSVINIALFPDRDIHPSSDTYSLIFERLTENQDILILVIILICIELVLVLYNIFKTIRKKMSKQQ